MFKTAKHCWHFCPVVSNRGTASTGIHHMFQSFWEVSGTFNTRNLSCHLSPKWHFVGFCWQFYRLSSHFLSNVCLEDLNARHLQPWFTPIRIKQTTLTNSFNFSPWQCHQKLFWALHALPMQFCQVWSKIYCICVVPSNQLLGNCRSHLTCTTIKHPVRVNEEGYGCKIQ